MSAFTLDYLARLELWGLALVVLQGGLVLASWLAWDRATANAAAASRHRLAGAHFAALAILPLAVLAVLQWTVTGMGPATPHESPAGEIASLAAGHRGVLAVVLAAAWLAGAALMLAQLARELRRVARLHREPAPAAWVAELRRLARRGRLAAVPALVVADVASPQVVGLRRAVLIAPRGFGARLPAAERKAVLLHELAHVRRRDFGWNLVQRVALALLWFHPAAWVLHARLARERELCCDALAVRHGASPTALARALVRLAEGAARPGLAMAIARRSELGARVHRLLGVESAPASGGMRAAAVAASVLCLVAFGAGRLGARDTAMGDLYKASDFGPTIAIQAHDASGAFALQVRQGRVIEASVEAQPIPPGRILQQGSRVTLMGAARQPIVVLTVSPQGTIHWKARS